MITFDNDGQTHDELNHDEESKSLSDSAIGPC